MRRRIAALALAAAAGVAALVGVAAASGSTTPNSGPVNSAISLPVAGGGGYQTFGRIMG
jgi:hypothetical protein